MKLKMFIPMALVLCLAFSLCACGTTVNTPADTTAPATTTATANTEATTTAPATEATTASTTVSASEFTADDALALVNNTYELNDDSLYYTSRGIYEIDGNNYYAVDLRKTIDVGTSYMSSYFVTLDGSDIFKGYIENEVASISDEKPAFEVTEDNAVKIVNAAYDFEEGCFLTYRGVEEIDGTTYHAVDLRKSLESNTTYLSTYFVKADGTQIVLGYYEGDTAVLAE